VVLRLVEGQPEPGRSTIVRDSSSLVPVMLSKHETVLATDSANQPTDYTVQLGVERLAHPGILPQTSVNQSLSGRVTVHRLTWCRISWAMFCAL